MSENTSANNSKSKTFAERAATDPTALHERFAEWIKENTGYDADLKTVQIVCAMRMDFQRSDENQNSLKARKEEAAKAKVEAAAKKKAKLLAELAKLEAAEKAEPAKTEEYDSEADQALSNDEDAVKAALAEQKETPEAPAQPDAPEAAETPSEASEEPAKRPVRRRRAAVKAAE